MLFQISWEWSITVNQLRSGKAGEMGSDFRLRLGWEERVRSVSYPCVPQELFLRERRGRDVKLATRLHLVLKLLMIGAVPPLSHMPLHRGASLLKAHRLFYVTSF
jgi:hypothetical protein